MPPASGTDAGLGGHQCGGVDQILGVSMRRIQCVSPLLSVADLLAPASQKLATARPNCGPVDGQASHNTDR